MRKYVNGVIKEKGKTQNIYYLRDSRIPEIPVQNKKFILKSKNGILVWEEEEN